MKRSKVISRGAALTDAKQSAAPQSPATAKQVSNSTLLQNRYCVEILFCMDIFILKQSRIYI